MSEIFIYLGFAIAAYSVIGNDVIQTLGTFISSNEKRPWWVLFLFAGSILTVTLLVGWYMNGGDVSYGRLIGDASQGYSADNPKYPFIADMSWWYLLPPAVLLVITRLGIPVSTSFMILTFFLPKGLNAMVVKSLMGYGLAFVIGILFYIIAAKALEGKFRNHEITKVEKTIWTTLQWGSTGFLWTLWLVQDFANIYVYLPRTLSPLMMFGSLAWLLALLAYIFWSKGGAIQGIVKSKSGTSDIRSATIIDFLYGSILLFFTFYNTVPMSTTWVFIGLLAGREYALRIQLDKKIDASLHKMVLNDGGKAAIGLVVSILLVFFIKLMEEGNFMVALN
jgi:hypothetical protein